MHKTPPVVQRIKNMMGRHRHILLCILFGSLANGKQTSFSDLDIAIAGKKPMNATQKKTLIEEFVSEVGRPVDLIDLQTASGTLLHQILTKGILIYCSDHQLYAAIMKKMLFNQSDMMPYHQRILKERRERWINK